MMKKGNAITRRLGIPGDVLPKILIMRNDAKRAGNCVYVTRAQMQKLLCEFAAGARRQRAFHFAISGYCHALMAEYNFYILP